MPYCVLRAPAGGGAVYTVAPVHYIGKARNVHRTQLKPFVTSQSVEPCLEVDDRGEEMPPLDDGK